MQKKFPHRVRCVGPLYPWMDGAIDELDRLVDEEEVSGLKFYPLDVWDNEYKVTRMNDETTFRVVDHARSRGLRLMSFHKAVPLGPLPREPFYALDDAAPLVAAFPDMIFEIVHGGGAFVRETAQLLADYPNVVINLESLPGFLFKMPEKVNEFMDAFLEVDPKGERIVYASGAVGMHPQPMLEIFWNHELPSGRLTEEVKRNILGLNAARFFGIDTAKATAAASSDEIGLHHSVDDLDRPWSTFRRAATA